MPRPCSPGRRSFGDVLHLYGVIREVFDDADQRNDVEAGAGAVRELGEALLVNGEAALARNLA